IAPLGIGRAERASPNEACIHSEPSKANGVVPPLDAAGKLVPSAWLKTRDLLKAAIRRQTTTWRVALACALIVLLFFTTALWQERSKTRYIPARAEEIHNNLVHSTVWIINRDLVPGALVQGSGALIEAERRLV